MAAALPILAATSAVMSIAGGIKGGLEAKQAALQQGRQDMQQAAIAGTAAGAEENATSRNAAREIGHGAAEAGAMGITAESAMPVLSEDYTQAKIRMAYEKFNGATAIREDTYAAQLAKYQGQQALYGGIFGGVQNAIGAASSLATLKGTSGATVGMPGNIQGLNTASSSS